MKIEISQQARTDALASIQRYFEENMPVPIGNMPAGHLLDFFVEEIGPLVYNRGISDAQARMAIRVSDLEGELHADEFQYWSRVDAQRRKTQQVTQTFTG